MGEKIEITCINGCIYEGVFHVLTPADPKPGGTRGMYQVCVLYYAVLVVAIEERLNVFLNKLMMSVFFVAYYHTYSLFVLLLLLYYDAAGVQSFFSSFFRVYFLVCFTARMLVLKAT